MENKTPHELLTVFYEEHHLGLDGGQSSSSVKMEITRGVHFYVPNFDARRKAVLWHDIHHLVTGYSAATFLGECEISAWEIASGCKTYWAAFLIDTPGVLFGLFLNPLKIMQAYSRGLRTTNLYHDAYSQEKVLDTTIAELRKWLLLDKHPKETNPTYRDFISLGLFLIFASFYSLLTIALIPSLIIYNIFVFFRKGLNK